MPSEARDLGQRHGQLDLVHACVVLVDLYQGRAGDWLRTAELLGQVVTGTTALENALPEIVDRAGFQPPEPTSGHEKPTI